MLTLTSIVLTLILITHLWGTVFSIFMLETEHRLDIKGEKGFFGNPD